MDFVEGVLLGLLQGLTEFLPVSSSGHLVLAQVLLGVEEPGLRLELALHVATLGSVLVYFRREILAILRDLVTGGPERRTGLLVVLGTLPVVVVGLLLRRQVETVGEEPVVAAAGLLATGMWLLLTGRGPVTAEGAAPKARPGVLDALLVGLAQAVAVLPGVSRSGATIGAALRRGVAPGDAARFSFLLSIPAVAGAGLLLLLETVGEDAAAGGSGTLPLLLAAAVAFGSGLGAIHALMKVLARGRLAAFGPYCLLVGAAALTWLYLG